MKRAKVIAPPVAISSRNRATISVELSASRSGFGALPSNPSFVCVLIVTLCVSKCCAFPTSVDTMHRQRSPQRASSRFLGLHCPQDDLRQVFRAQVLIEAAGDV